MKNISDYFFEKLKIKRSDNYEYIDEISEPFEYNGETIKPGDYIPTTFYGCAFDTTAKKLTDVLGIQPKVYFTERKRGESDSMFTWKNMKYVIQGKEMIEIPFEMYDIYEPWNKTKKSEIWDKTVEYRISTNSREESNLIYKYLSNQL